MKILVVHNRYRNRAGEDSTFDQEVEILKNSCHGIQTFIVDNKTIKTNNLKQLISLAINTVWSCSSYRNISEILREYKPDIVHVHNFFPLLSPSIFYACKKYKIPVVMTIQNYRLSCPAGTFFREDKICELCREKSLLYSIYYSCYRNSRFQTSVVFLMILIHKILKTWNTKISAYIAVSPFLGNKLVEIGIPEKKIYTKPNFLKAKKNDKKQSTFGDYYLFVGRLTQEKGILQLLDAYQSSNSNYPLIIIGSGELQFAVEKAAQDNPSIQYLGQQTREQVLSYMKQAIALIFPSIWYEGFPLTILEAYSQSLPVVGSDIGSVSYAIENGVTGLTFPVGDEQALSQIFPSIEADPEKWIELKKKVLDSLSDTYFPNHNIDCLLEIYRNVISS